MIQSRRRFGFAPKSLQRLAVSGQVFRKELESNKPVEASIFSLVDHTHPASAKPFHDAVVGDGLPDQRVGVRHLAHILGRGQWQVNERNSRTELTWIAGKRS